MAEENLTAREKDEQIELSNFSKALLEALEGIQKKPLDSDLAPLTVSRTVSFFSILYEKVRNAVEFREEHLVRRAAIERILNRRLSLNPEGRGEAENLMRELLWARYLPADSVTTGDISHIQMILDKYLHLKKKVLTGRDNKSREKMAQYLTDFLSCEIEEELNPESTQKKAAFLYFFYQVLKNKVEIKHIPRDSVDTYFYIASEIALAKNDRPYVRYHLFQLFTGSLYKASMEKIESLTHQMPEIITKIDQAIKNSYNDKLVRFAKRQVPPFLILFAVCDRYPKELKKILTNPLQLWEKVDTICREKYQETGVKLRNAAIRSVIYIFLTKAVFALILEYPLSLYIYGDVHLIPIAINTIFPPILMALIISFVHIPGDRNTKKIYDRVEDILNMDPSFETTKTLIAGKPRVKRPILVLGFTVLYLLTFGITFLLIYLILSLLHFNLIGMTVFVFFVSLVAFFGYRIKQTTKEYTLGDRDGILSPLVDFFFVPVLFVGKFLSQEIAKLNIFILIFDFLIEAPFKLIAEIVEEWINFVKARKEEIA